MTDRLNAPYKVSFALAKYDGDWTAEQIGAGEAGAPIIEEQTEWYEPGPEGPVPVTDPDRIAALEQRASETRSKAWP